MVGTVYAINSRSIKHLDPLGPYAEMMPLDATTSLKCLPYFLGIRVVESEVNPMVPNTATYLDSF